MIRVKDVQGFKELEAVVDATKGKIIIPYLKANHKCEKCKVSLSFIIVEIDLNGSRIVVRKKCGFCGWVFKYAEL